MITGYEAFCFYQSVKLHFTSDTYDFHKYGGKSKITVDTFEKRKDKYYFYKLSRRLTTKEELIKFLVANFVKDENTWVGSLLEDDSEKYYRERQKVIQSLSYNFQNDCEKIFEHVENPNSILQVEDGAYPKLLTMALRNEVQLETVCILNKILRFLPMWENKIDDTVRFPLYKKKISKYTSFLEFDESRFKIILKKVINEKVIS